MRVFYTRQIFSRDKNIRPGEVLQKYSSRGQFPKEMFYRTGKKLRKPIAKQNRNTNINYIDDDDHDDDNYDDNDDDDDDDNDINEWRCIDRGEC